jgi:hypothetical protein
MILSLAMPDPGFIWQLILAIGLVASIGANLAVMRSVKQVQRREISPQPLGVTGDIQVTSKGRRFSGDMCDDRHGAIAREMAALDIYTREEVGRIHDKIDLVERRGNDNLAENMNEIKETLRKMPHEIMLLINDASDVKGRHNA